MTRSSLGVDAVIAGGAFFLMLFLETLRPLRRRVEDRFRRTGRNLAAGGLALAAVTVLQAFFLAPVAAWGQGQGVGLLNLVKAPSVVRDVLAILLLDYTLWHWHRVNHVVPFFWRFHLVHHIDRDMDASTAFRFHFGEQSLSVGFRLIQVLLVGPSAAALWGFHALLVVSILFHHSNTRLPIGLERLLVRVIVTPRMHGIHHSSYPNETDSNWSSLFSIWDYLHRTIRLDIPQASIEIGVPAFEDPQSVTIGKILAIPFIRRPDDWVRSDGGPRVRDHSPISPSLLEP